MVIHLNSVEMKQRKPLLRKAPMKRGGALKRSPLRRVSKDKALCNSRYHREKAKRIKENPICVVCQSRWAKDGHHPDGQQGEKIMNFILVCRPCHQKIEDNKKWAREEGWITYK